MKTTNETNSLEEQIRRFLTPDFGYGSGYGSGSGSGYGSGDGDGDGSGSGSGSGYGSGYGDGSGDGDGIAVFDGKNIYQVDGVSTAINSVHGQYAKGFILNRDLTTTTCFIARVGNSYAHGKTLHDAQRDAVAKDMENRPLPERLKAFRNAYPNADVPIDGHELYDWHHVLTGSCKMGRDSWCQDHGLSPDRDRLTVAEFCRLTKDSYGGDAIRALAESYGLEL